MMIELQQFAQGVRELGWAVTTPVIDDRAIAMLRGDVAHVAVDGRGGTRNLLERPLVRFLAKSPPLRDLAASVLGDSCFAVRAILFDKTPSANWKVVWHQDLTIATRERAEVSGYGPWTEKEGVAHVQPPVEVLERMIAIRLHLDPCGRDNGPVRVISGTQSLGRLNADAIDELRRTLAETDCLAEQGAVLAFRPLILHASAPASLPAHRRVIHIEYAACELAAPLNWHRRV